MDHVLDEHNLPLIPKSSDYREHSGHVPYNFFPNNYNLIRGSSSQPSFIPPKKDHHLHSKLHSITHVATKVHVILRSFCSVNMDA